MKEQEWKPILSTTSDGNPFSVVFCLFMNPLMDTHMPSTVSRVKTSNLLAIGAEENTRLAPSLKLINATIAINSFKNNNKRNEEKETLELRIKSMYLTF